MKAKYLPYIPSHEQIYDHIYTDVIISVSESYYVYGESEWHINADPKLPKIETRNLKYRFL